MTFSSSRFGTKNGTVSIEKTVIRRGMSLGGQEESKSSITYKDNTSPDSPMAFFDEPNRKVLIISNEHQKENDKGSQMNGSE